MPRDAGTFLCFAAFTYRTWDRMGLAEVPRLALVLAAALSLAGCLAARALVFVFERQVEPERNLARQLAPGPGRNVLVIGGGGYIGSALLPKRLADGCHVRILDCFLYGQKAIDPYLDHPRVEVMKVNFCNLQTVVEAMRGRAGH